MPTTTPHPTSPSAPQPTIDLRHVCCGLVPAILDELKRFQGDQVDVLIRAGIEPEIISGFGTGGDWAFQFLPSFGYGLARFTRRPPDPAKRVRLDTLDY
ncbi:MAG: hypothetical protein P4L39_07650 [Humidesulfovibrio sp.]|nr:hypothetical protein [Humidesulfovibrio sp.]